ncbi:hypothetical protein [Parabacteroides sp. ZJ-118]|uniref:hypothetical protein n=1 Tax=Parabacteroides sp. ZJ-118 TaxID=2709398 RepID=UPI0013ED034A|nr:hypothetical protein [Parabacteroides sp. ZJ-118]
MWRLIGMSDNFISAKIAFLPLSSYLKPNIQSLFPSLTKYLSFIHILGLLECLRYDHHFSWFIKIWSIRLNTSFDTTWL